MREPLRMVASMVLNWECQCQKQRNSLHAHTCTHKSKVTYYTCTVSPWQNRTHIYYACTVRSSSCFVSYTQCIMIIIISFFGWYIFFFLSCISSVHRIAMLRLKPIQQYTTMHRGNFEGQAISFLSLFLGISCSFGLLPFRLSHML